MNLFTLNGQGSCLENANERKYSRMENIASQEIKTLHAYSPCLWRIFITIIPGEHEARLQANLIRSFSYVVKDFEMKHFRKTAYNRRKILFFFFLYIQYKSLQ